MPITIVKIGGNVIDSEESMNTFLDDFAALSGDKILVHGGGKIATKMAADLGIETKMIEGRRITDAAMRDVVTMVYGGLVNKRIVAALQQRDTNALGFTGADAGIIKSKKRTGTAIDYGFVGDVESVNASFIVQLLSLGITPIFAPLTFDKAYGLLNTNADTQASTVATALAQDRVVNLVYCFEKKGVLMDANDDTTVIPILRPDLYAQYRKEGKIYEGMIPKLDNAFDAVEKGVKKVIICSAEDLIPAATKGAAGTSIQL